MRTLAWIALVTVGCGSEASTGPVPLAVAQDVCADLCTRDEMCGTLDPTETVEQCTSSCTSDVGGIREDAFISVGSCVAGLACTADEDTCIAECQPTGAHTAYETQCRTKGAECGIPAENLNELCEVTPVAGTDTGFLCLVTPAAINELAACFDDPCTGLEACVSAWAEKYDL